MFIADKETGYEAEENVYTFRSGSTISSVIGLREGSDCVSIEFSDKSRISLFHEQDCCEEVEICDIDGDEDDLVGATFIKMVESIQRYDNDVKECDDDDYDIDGTHTWTFYTIHTSKGTVWIRWLGKSNGFYSEEVTVETIE